MCSVGDSFNIELSEGIALCEYVCEDCGKEFKGLATAKIKCPVCHSVKTVKK